MRSHSYRRPANHDEWFGSRSPDSDHDEYHDNNDKAQSNDDQRMVLNEATATTNKRSTNRSRWIVISCGIGYLIAAIAAQFGVAIHHATIRIVDETPPTINILLLRGGLEAPSMPLLLREPSAAQPVLQRANLFVRDITHHHHPIKSSEKPLLVGSPSVNFDSNANANFGSEAIVLHSLSSFAALRSRYLSTLVETDNSSSVSAVQEPTNLQELPQMRTCLSPERMVPFPYNASSNAVLEGLSTETIVGRSRTSSTTCHIGNQTTFTQYLSHLSKQIQHFTERQCKSMLVYSVAFGPVRKLSKHPAPRTDKRRANGNCTLIFVLAESIALSSSWQPAYPGSDNVLLYSVKDSSALRIPIPRAILPYQSMRRNVKLLKMHGVQLFPWADRLLWMDAKLYRRISSLLLRMHFRRRIDRYGVCASFVAAPLHPSIVGAGAYAAAVSVAIMTTSVVPEPASDMISSSSSNNSTNDDDDDEDNEEGQGQDNEDEDEDNVDMNDTSLSPPLSPPLPLPTLGLMQPMNSRLVSFADHCDAIMAGIKRRPTITDSVTALRSQCSYYLQETKMRRHLVSRDDSDQRRGYLTTLDAVLIDSAVIAWDQRTNRCRQFNADLGCTWDDETQCHADRDQVSFPYTLYRMNLQERNQQPVTDTATQDTVWFDTATSTPVISIMKSKCHWYNGPTFLCR